MRFRATVIELLHLLAHRTIPFKVLLPELVTHVCICTQTRPATNTQANTDTHARNTGGPVSPSLSYLEGPDKGVFSAHHVWASLLTKQCLREEN